MNLLEKIGFALIILGVVLLIIKNFLENPTISNIAQEYDFFHWLGMGIWAIGYIIRENKKSK